MQDLSLMTWKEAAEIDKDKSILFVTVAPIEEHGVHLPLATDLIEGENWSGGAMKILEQTTEYRCYFLPAFPIAAASVNSFYGCIHFPMRTVYKVVRELLESVACMGFRNVVVVASHADPEHQIAVEKAVRSINRRYGEIAISPKRQRAAMGEYGHMGDPTAADYQIGKLLNEDCAEYLARAARCFAKRDGYQTFTHYAMYDIVFLHLGFLPMLGRVKRKKVSK